MEFSLEAESPAGNTVYKRRALLSDERAESSYAIPVLVLDGQALGTAEIPADTKLTIIWRKARTGPVWGFIQKALDAGYPINIDYY